MLDTFFEQIRDAQASLGLHNDEEFFFRGQPDNRWPLLPSLLRHSRQEQLKRQETRDLEATLFFEFQSRARELHQRTLSGWDVLFFMRHHGVATRILDWTEVLGVALYFAVHGVQGGATPCVWVLNPYALNERSWDVRDLVAPQFLSDQRGVERDYEHFVVGGYPRFGWDYPVSLYPLQLSNRLQAQRGYFTIHGENERSLDEINARVRKKFAVRIDLEDSRLIDEVRWYLDASGIDTHLLFPDLDGLARYLHEKYKILSSPQASIYGTSTRTESCAEKGGSAAKKPKE